MEVNEIRIDRMTNDYLAKVYDGICEEYRRRICKQWDLDIKQTWWIPSNRVGEVLALNDVEYTLDMSEIRLFVKRGISFEEFLKWWNYNYDAREHDCDTINAYSWFNGYRGEKGGVG